MNQITMSVIQIFISLIVETIILGGVFAWITNKASVKMEQALKDEMNNIENQNKMIYQEIEKMIMQSRDDVISEIKEVMK